jgi:methyl-accepting chemotaxis protein
MAQSSAENATTALERTTRMDAMVAECRLQITELSRGVALSLEKIGESLKKIDDLEAIGLNIEKIVDGIGLVSIQTNMLAVNGSVEAARAGEFGKGFAVVSKDIRSLARDSGENAGRIKDTVRAIQGRIAAVKRDLERAIADADVENQKTATVLASFETVINDIAEIAASNTQIGGDAKAILTSMKDAADSARQVATVAEEASGAATQAATAAKQQARGAEDLAAAIEEIASLAETIQSRNG